MLSDKRIVVPAMTVMALAILLLDVSFPNSQTTAPLYVAVVGAALLLPSRRPALIAAAACTLLTVIGFFMSDRGGALHIDLGDRMVSIVAIWVVAGICVLHKRREETMLRLAAIVQSSDDAIISKTLDGAILSWNNGAEKLFGYREDEMIGRSASLLARPGDAETERQVMRAVGRGEHVRGRETVRVRKDGSEVELFISAAPIRDAAGKVVAAATIARDITERKRAEKELLEAKNAAEAASRAKSQFLADMSHEIRTPMNGVFGMLDLALDTELKPGQRHFLERAKASADLLLRVINDILDFSKMEAERMELDSADFNLREIAAETVQAFGPRAHDKGLELALHVRPDIPDELVGDPHRLAQILTNLVGNAIKFTDRGEVVVHAEAESVDDNGVRLHFSVTDTGAGIPPEKQRLIFDAFAQADSSMARRFGGTGLGLAISARLIELMGGRIWVESEVGKGSTFHFTATFARSAQRETRKKVAPRIDLEGMPVLVADDNATNRTILAEMLSNWRMTPTLADGGKAALAAAHDAATPEQAFPLVLLDSVMPDLDGFAVAQRIKQDPNQRGAIILMLSSAEQPGDLERCRELDIAAFLRKPIRQSQLHDAILTALGKLANEPAAAAAAPKDVRRSLRILLAEDNEVNQDFAVSLLQKHGHRVVIANDGREAVAAWESEPFDVILMDVQMPEMDGFAATRAIREREEGTQRHIPIIAATAYALTGDRERCMAAGMDAYVSKPIRGAALLEVIANVISANPGAPPADPTPQEAQPQSAQAQNAFDLDTALEYVEGERDVLRNMVAIYLKNSPRLQQEIREAIANGDSDALMRSAHRLRGSMSMLAATAACVPAQTLEDMAETGDLTGAPAVHAELEREVNRLEEALVRFSKEVAA